MSIKHNHGQPINFHSPNIRDEQRQRFRELFPEIFSEGDKIDWEKLRLTLGEIVDDSPERYSFSWAGKKDAIRLLQTPTRATLSSAHDESVNFDKTEHLFIEGDNLEVMKLLYKSYFGRIKMMSIDPPYNTGNDFIYPDNYRDPLDHYLKISGQKDNEGNLLTSKPIKNGHIHSAWLSMMYPRLFLARQLLTDDGIIFICIDDNEVYNLRILMNDIFGEENFVANIVWQKKQSPQNDAIYFSAMHDHIIVYVKRSKSTRGDPEGWECRLLPRGEKQEERYSNPDNDPRGDWTSVDYTCNKTADERKNLYYSILNPHTKKEVWPSKQRVWRFEKKAHEKNAREDRIWWGESGENFPRLKRFRSEVRAGVVPSTWWDRIQAGDNQKARREIRALFDGIEDSFDTPKPVKLIKQMLKIATDPSENALIMDFFAGSCTTAHAVLDLNKEDGGNRRFIMVQLPEPIKDRHFPSIAEIGKERIRRVIDKMKEGRRVSETMTQTAGSSKEGEDLGFKVFKLSESNFKSWQGVKEDKPEEYIKQMEMFVDPLKDKWKPYDVIYEVALKEGYGLNLKIEKMKKVVGNKVYQVTDPDKKQSFYICLDKTVTLDALAPLELTRDHILICRDVALDDDTAANLALQCRLKTI